MRIMHVIHGFPPRNNAGAEIYHYNLAREQALTNNVAIFYRYGDEGDAEYSVADERRDGMNIRRINITQHNCKSYEEIYTNPPVAAEFARFLDEFRPDVVHIGHLVSLSTRIIDEARQRGIPTVMTLHDFWMLCPRGQLIDKELKICERPEAAPCDQCQQLEIRISPLSHAAFALYRKLTRTFHLGENFMRGLLRRMYILMSGKQKGDDNSAGPIQNRRKTMRELFDKIDLFISPSEFLRGVFIDNGMPPNKIIHSDNGQDTSPFRDFKRTASDKIRFGFVGSIIPSKGLHVLLEAFRGIDAKYAELNIYGGFSKSHEHKDYTERIKRLANAEGIHLRGRYLPEEVASVYAEIDVLVVPSIWYENQPLVIMEAFMSGAPVIASNLGGMAEIVRDGENGLLFDMGVASSLRAAMQRIIDDPGLVQRLAEQVPQVKTVENNATEIANIYQSILRNRIA